MSYTQTTIKKEYNRLAKYGLTTKPHHPLIAIIQDAIAKGSELKPGEIDFWQHSFSFMPIQMTGIEIPINENAAKHLRKTFNVAEHIPITHIKPDYYCGRTKTHYLFNKIKHIYKQVNNRLIREDIPITYWVAEKDIIGHDSPLKHIWDSLKIDIAPLNEMLAKKNRQLKEHQYLGIKFLLSVKRGFLEDEQGLMKTSTSISAALLSGAKKILIVTLASTKINWMRELGYYGIDDVQIIMGTKAEFKNTKFTIINYDILGDYESISMREKPYIDILSTQGYDCIIADECHKAKDMKSIRSKVLTKLTASSEVKYVWGLSGTLIEKHEEFFEVCNSLGINIQQEVLTSYGHPYNNRKKSYDNYKIKYCNGFTANFKKKIDPKTGVQRDNITYIADPKNPNSNVLALSTISAANRLRREFKEVFPDFVDLHENTMYFTLTPQQMDEYSTLYQNYIDKKGREIEDEKAAIATELQLMRQYLAKQQVEHTTLYVETLVDYGHKVIIFTHFKEELQMLYENFETIAVKLEAGKHTANQQAIDAFQNNEEIRVIIGNILTMGTGHNITKGDYIIHNSPDWGAGEIMQGNSRSHRFGRVGDVNVVYMLFDGLATEYVYNKSMGKRENKKLFDNI